MSADFESFDWTSVLNCLDEIGRRPDAYHATTGAGSTIYPIEWLNFKTPPANSSPATWWSSYEALAMLSAHNCDRYSAETLLIAHSPLVQDVVMKTLQRRGLFRRERYEITPIGGDRKKVKQVDGGGLDVYQDTILDVLENLVQLTDLERDESCCDGPDDGADISDLLADRIRKVAQTASGTSLKRQQRWWNRFRSLDWKATPEPIQAETPYHTMEEQRRHDNAVQALNDSIENDTQRKIIEMRELRMSDKRIGEALDMPEHEVNRTWHRVLARVEQKLELAPGRIIRRATRNRS